MNIKSHISNRKLAVRSVLGLIGVVMLAALLSACAGGGAGSTLPTAIPAEQIGSGASGQAADSYQATWDAYLRDSIAVANLERTNKIGLLERYELPSITAKNLNGILKQIDLVQDRTTFSLNASGGRADSNAEFDVKLTYANGDTDTRTCKIAVAIEKDPDTNKWFMINPGPLEVFAICPKS